ncbi:MAG: hypothetical protein IPP47_17615 [Bryobacterales bacterium]|nr:hypothetical protein [Bryobacterales bacterium]
MSLIAALIAGAAFAAASGKPKEEKTKGEIISVGEDSLQIKTKKATITVILTQKPSIVMDGAQMPPAALKRGVKVTVLGAAQPSGEIIAREIQLPAPASAMPMQMPSGSGGHSH